MPPLILAAAIALTSGNTTIPVDPATPPIRVSLADLRLGEADSRRDLVSRVHAAARNFCDAHGREITPDHLRADPRFCGNAIRASIVQAMTPDVRAAYRLGRREGP